MNQYTGVSPAFVPSTLGSSRESSERGRAASYKEIGNSSNAGKRSLAQAVHAPGFWETVNHSDNH